MPTFIGVDPGASGGLAVLATGLDAYACPMPATERDIWEYLRDEAASAEGPVAAVIEKVGGYTGQGQPGSAMFKFGASYGRLCMALCAAGIPYEEITPQTWQKAMGIPPRKNREGETKTAWKNRLKSHAQRLFPKLSVTLATADAILIAEFCRRKVEGRL